MVLLIPGPEVLYVVTRSLSQGQPAGLVKLLGAGYLIFLGLRTLLTREPREKLAASAPRPLGRLFRDGVLVSALNPKLAMFVLAFLPQFADPNRGPVSQQILLLGFIYMGLALITDGTYELLAGRLRQHLGEGLFQGPIPRYVSGGIYLGLGASTALVGRRD